jgi:hypothetical protein
MTTTLTNIKAQEHTNELPRDAQRRRRRVKIRRIAVIHPESAHFKLRPIRGAREAAER